jgi:hypothetical protein
MVASLHGLYLSVASLARGARLAANGSPVTAGVIEPAAECGAPFARVSSSPTVAGAARRARIHKRGRRTRQMNRTVKDATINLPLPRS